MPSPDSNENTMRRNYIFTDRTKQPAELLLWLVKKQFIEKVLQ